MSDEYLKTVRQLQEKHAEQFDTIKEQAVKILELKDDVASLEKQLKRCGKPVEKRNEMVISAAFIIGFILGGLFYGL